MNYPKNKHIHIRIDYVEYSILKKKMEAARITNVSEFIRRLIKTNPVVNFANSPLTDYVIELRKLSAEINAIGKNINQIAKKTNIDFENIYQEDIDFIKDNIETIKEQINSTVLDTSKILIALVTNKKSKE